MSAYMGVLDTALDMLVRMEKSQPSRPAGTTGLLHGALDHRWKALWFQRNCQIISLYRGSRIP